MGTLGLFAEDLEDRGLGIAANNHVLADVNSGEIGDPIRQPFGFAARPLGVPPALQIERKPDPDHEHQTERNSYGHDERRRLTPKRKQEVLLVEIGKAPLFRLRMVRRAVGDLSHAVADADDLDQLALRLVFPVFARKALKSTGISIILFMHLPEGCSLTLDSPPTNSMTLK